MEEYPAIELQIPQREAYIPATLVLPEGNGPHPLAAIVHGFSGSRQEGGGYPPLAQKLAANGVASIRMDFSGCGDSVESFRLGTLSNMIADVRACFDYCLAHYPIDAARLGIMGMSLGGRVAMEVLNSGLPKLSAGLLVAPAADLQTIQGVIGDEAAWQKAYRYARAEGFVAIPCYFGGPDLELSPEWFEDLETMDTLGSARPLGIPVEVVYAEDDLVVSPAVPKRCAAAYGAKLFEISGDGHVFGYYSDRKDVLNRVIDEAAAFFASSL